MLLRGAHLVLVAHGGYEVNGQGGFVTSLECLAVSALVDIAEEKAALRRQLLLKRQEIVRHGAQAGYRLAVMARTLPIEPSAVIAGYLPMMDEFDILPMLRAFADNGHVIAMPQVVAPAMPLIFRAWEPGDPVEKGLFNTRQPLASAPLVEPTVYFIPLLGFDRRGHRLGYGGGYYDRTLQEARSKRTIIAFGVGYRGLEVPHIPTDSHDVRLQGIVTEVEFIRPW